MPIEYYDYGRCLTQEYQRYQKLSFQDRKQYRIENGAPSKYGRAKRQTKTLKHRF